MIVSVETPDATDFGASVVLSAVTNFTVDEAVKTTLVPVSAVAAKGTVFPEVMTLLDGTATVAGAVVVVALVAVATVTASGAAEEGATESPTIARAAAVAIDIFLNDFILFISPFIICLLTSQKFVTCSHYVRRF